jgi:hypothetical protein
LRSPAEGRFVTWSLREEICAQLAPAVRDWGGRLVVALPHLEVM